MSDLTDFPYIAALDNDRLTPIVSQVVASQQLDRVLRQVADPLAVALAYNSELTSTRGAVASNLCHFIRRQSRRKLGPYGHGQNQTLGNLREWRTS